MAPEKESHSGLLYSLVSFVSFIVGWCAAIRLGNTPNQQNIKPIQTEDSADRDSNIRQNENNIPSRTITKIQVPPSEGQGDKAKGKNRRRKIRKLRKAGAAWVSLGTFLIVLAYTLIARHQWEQMKIAAEAGVRAANATRDAMKADQRAWIGLDNPPRVTITPFNQRNVRQVIDVTIKNFGKGPALKVMSFELIVTSDLDNNVQSICNVLLPFVGLKPTTPTFGDYGRMLHPGSVIFPTQKITGGGGSVINFSDLIGKEAYVIGCIVYQDQFSDPHWTKFCYKTGDSVEDVVKDASSFNTLYVCSRNNYTDDTENK